MSCPVSPPAGSLPDDCASESGLSLSTPCPGHLHSIYCFSGFCDQIPHKKAPYDESTYFVSGLGYTLMADGGGS